MKFFADGSIGGRTAALKDGYDGKLSDELLLTEDLDRYSQECVDRGFQISIHAIGDMAIEYVIDSIESFENKSYKTHRIEHCELCNEKIIGGIKKNNIMVSFQPAFIHEFGDKYIKNLGIDRIRRIHLLTVTHCRGSNMQLKERPEREMQLTRRKEYLFMKH